MFPQEINIDIKIKHEFCEIAAQLNVTKISVDLQALAKNFVMMFMAILICL